MFCGVELNLIKKGDVPRILRYKHKMVLLKAMTMILCELEEFAKKEDKQELEMVYYNWIEKNLKHYLSTMIDPYVLRMDLCGHVNGDNLTSENVFEVYVAHARKVRTLENMSIPTYHSELQLSQKDICRWDEEKQQFEIDNKKTLTDLWLKEVDSFKWKQSNLIL